ncbi:MAG: bifunctional folylpolyglutamate synthase/dihydrofolate synthase [Lachnospiraceae bacterium]|jgi:dihydrofolate synthase/folylpolyglutamate synthase|nr:bifunctional folylpolyglutamate synthase/dihydrofolate synthase [Lachnospiraceae bacterium]
MTYEEARNFIKESNQYGIVPGLETITELLRRLGNPQEQLCIIHVAGTNGKGSASAFLTAILIEAGYHVGRYLSPAVFSYRERIQIGDKGASAMAYITQQGICESVEQIQPVCDAMVQDGYPHPTSFEIETAMAMLYLAKEKVDFAIIEVGMGGRLDATNVIQHPVCCVITSISMDHMQYLGDTLEQIAGEKAGIIKENVPVVTGRQKPEVRKVLEMTCREKGAKLILSDFDKIAEVNYDPEETVFTLQTDTGNKKYRIRLLGEYQTENALLAVKAATLLENLGYRIGEEAVRNGLSKARWRGRFEIIAKEPYVIIDGAHNEDAAMRLRRSIEVYFTNRRIIYIIGVLADKDYQTILDLTAPLADVIITLTPDNKRALSGTELAKQAERFGKRVIDAGTAQNAIHAAYETARKEDVIIAFGSLSYLGDLVKTLENRYVKADLLN